MTTQKPKVLLKETYIKMIENSIGTKMFNSILIEDEKGESKDILNNGEFSCAVFVSSVLTLFGLLTKSRATVNNLYSDLVEGRNFEKTTEEEITPGDIIFWEEFEFEDGSVNKHVGFYIGDNQAISTNYLQKQVIRHHYKNFSSGERGIEAVFRVTTI